MIAAALKTALTVAPVFWPNTPPLGVSALKAYLGANGIKADCIDLNNIFYGAASASLKKEWLRSCNRELERDIWEILKREHSCLLDRVLKELSGYDTVGFSCHKSNIRASFKFADAIKDHNSKVRIVLGGPEITHQYLEHGHEMLGGFPSADYLIAGEGEAPLLKYLLGQIPATARISAFDEVMSENSLEMPDLSDFSGPAYPKQGFVPAIATRGCVRKCRFCAEKLLSEKFKRTPVPKVIDFIGRHNVPGETRFVFHDSMLNADHEYFNDILDGFIARFGRIRWESQIGIRDNTPDGLLKKMVDSGCYDLFIGLESGSDRTLSAMNKGYTADIALSFFRKLKDNGLTFGVSLITGYPGETEKDFADSVEFVTRNKCLIPKIAQINPFVTYPGTGFKNADDYKNHAVSLERAKIFINEARAAGFKLTNAFMLNLTEREWR
jgi:radical SAM superfamily enzyme YgiQ (UPF0313 family)